MAQHVELTADFKTYQERITSSLVGVTRSTAQISNQDLSFHRSSSEKFSESLDARSSHLLRLTSKLLKAAAKESVAKPPSLKDADDVEDNWRSIVDIVDDLLEKADASIDEFTGVLKRMSPAVPGSPEPPSKKPRFSHNNDMLAQANPIRPQDDFEHKVNNYETGAWKPLIKTKPHAIVPLIESVGSGQEGYKHPYMHEIEVLEYPASMFAVSEPIPYTSPDESAPIFVDTEDGVRQMLAELKLATEIAVDLEHNDRNSFVGMVCLMQISTRNKDWIVDTLKPWRENLQVLNEVFANPKIIKVFHGSASDIIWLQRDLGLYIVGLFDTYYASNALAFPQKSLKYLLHKYANFEAQKQFQLSDWRIRPLPQELLDYARSDTHYLLYIFDNLRNTLLQASSDHAKMHFVLENSKKESLQVYERHPYDRENGLGSGGWLRMLMSRSTGFNNEQFGVFRALHEWRDQKARELDEGEQSIMPNQYIFLYAEHMPTRRSMFFQRGMSIGRLPPRITELLPEIIQVIIKGREDGKNGPSIYDAIEKNGDKVGFMFGKNKYPKKKPEETFSAVGATLQHLNQTAGAITTPPLSFESQVSETPVAARTPASDLFGPISLFSSLASFNPMLVAQALQAVLPVNMFRTPNDVASILPETDTTIPTAQSNSNTNGVSQVSSQILPAADDAFTLKDRNRKRKAETMNDTVGGNSTATSPATAQSMQADYEPISSPADAARDIKRQRKAEKKARKAQQEAERRQNQTNLVPFDYANAQSVLNAKPEPTTNNSSKQPKPLNPFARAMDTSTGARRNRAAKEMPGRSHTFTS